ncbi:MAG TPA: 1-(5-phosphoribosyl)-5-amino-4-imidazole-carboxylate carboxylase, partial [Geobacteraceae bacterium]
MDTGDLQQLLISLQQGELSVADAMERLRHLPFEDLGDATIDHHRSLRQGFPEVVFGATKSVGQVERIVAALL